MTHVITGVAGFIGSNLALRLLEQGEKVVGIDNLSRQGAKINLELLRPYKNFVFKQGDIRDSEFIENAFKNERQCKSIFHFAAQVAVTTSVRNPREDFDINAAGTFNVLEAVRKAELDAAIIYSSTNKVYGKLDQLKVTEHESRYQYSGGITGVGEKQQLDFYSPYGCSKGCGDQYVVDYNRIYGLKTISFRQSCIYGYNQFGMEDQGWVAWFTIASILGKPLTLYGDGKQVRDILFVDDLVELYIESVRNIDTLAGEAFNIGGGPDNTLSLLELLNMLEAKLGHSISVKYSDWRPGDQKVFICNIDKIHEKTGWKPKVSAKEGVDKLFNWCNGNSSIIKGVLD